MPEREAVRSMFSTIAPRYDFLNRLLSVGIDTRWRRRAVKKSGAGPESRVFDVCCGTGDLSFEFARQGARVLGGDFVLPMVSLAARKSLGLRVKPQFVLADALELPVASGSFDVVSVAFGIRNVQDRPAGLRELRRVVKSGGRAVVLEFTTPPGRLFRGAFDFYFHRILPAIGNALAGTPTSAYRYLPDSVKSFPGAPEFAGELREAGFSRVEFEYLTRGVAAIHVATA